jgi:hypothetical protein
MQGKMGIETRNIIRDSKQYHIIKILKICLNKWVYNADLHLAQYYVKRK